MQRSISQIKASSCCLRPRKHKCDSRAATPAPNVHQHSVQWLMPLTARLCYIAFFFFLHLWICADSSRFGPNSRQTGLICIEPGWFAPIQAESDHVGRWLKHAEKGRMRLKPVLNQAEILVKKNYAKLTILNFEALCLLPLLYITLRLPSLTP